MKKFRSILLLAMVIISFSFARCTKDSDQEVQAYQTMNKSGFDTIYFKHSMKGWELYSWPNGDDWYFSILAGTNRTKTYSEVIQSPFIVCSADSLKLLLNKFPANEEIFWIGEEWLDRCWGNYYGNLALPDIYTISEIKAYSIQKKLLLSISE
jgi:hypothetical protein